LKEDWKEFSVWDVNITVFQIVAKRMGSERKCSARLAYKYY